jgi:hypothetical protein
MAEEKTTKVFVRLTRDFPAGVTHRRGGVAMVAGPRPVEAQVTKEQLKALETDPKVEIVDEAEAKKWEERDKTEPTHPSSAELAAAETSSDSQDGGRNYDDGNDGSSSGQGGSDDGSGASDEGTGEGEGEGDGPVEVTTDMKVKDLVQIAKDEGVENADDFSKPGVKKQEIVDAILAKRAETSSDSQE